MRKNVYFFGLIMGLLGLVVGFLGDYNIATYLLACGIFNLAIYIADKD